MRNKSKQIFISVQNWLKVTMFGMNSKRKVLKKVSDKELSEKVIVLKSMSFSRLRFDCFLNVLRYEEKRNQLTRF